MSDFRITPRHVENSRGWERLGTNSSLDFGYGSGFMSERCPTPNKVYKNMADSKEQFTMSLIFSDPLDPDHPKGLIKSSFNSGR